MIRFSKETFLLLLLVIIVLLQVLSFHGPNRATADGWQKCAHTACNVTVGNKTTSVSVDFPFGVEEGCGASEEFLLSGCNITTANNSELLWNGFQQFYKDNSTEQPPPFIFNIIYENTSFTPTSTPQTVNITWNHTVLEAPATTSCAVNVTGNITEYFPNGATIDLSHSPLTISNTTSVLFFGCSQINSSAYVFNNSSRLCDLYRNECAIPKNLECFEWNPTTQININKTMTENSCIYFQTMVSKKMQGNEATDNNNTIVWKAGLMQLRWNNDSIPTYSKCNSCLRSSGGCGYDPNNISTTTFQCYCPDGNTIMPENCLSSVTATPPAASTVDNSSSNKNRSVIKIALPVAAASLVVLLLVLLSFFLIYRSRRSKKSYTTDRSIPNTIILSNKIWTERANLLSRKFGPVRTNEFSYEELIRATDDFAEKNCIGDGGFGAVYIGFMKDGSQVAVKRLYHDNFRKMDQFYNEMQILSTLKHPNLVKLHGFCCEHDKDLLLVFEYAANGTVSDQLHGKSSKPTMSWFVRLKIAYQTAGALHYLHNIVSPPIYHRDVKTTNILLDDDYHVKLADFGLSRLVPMEVTHVSTAPQGTPGYVDPEYHTSYQLTDKSDVYSFGVVLMELVSAKLAVDMTRSKKEINLSSLALAKITAQSQHELIDRALEIDKHPEIEKSVKAVIEVAFRCLQPEKDDRPNMKEVYEILTQIWNEYTGYQETDMFKSKPGSGNEETKSADTFLDPYNSKSDLSVAPSPADETCKLIKVKSEVNSADSSVWTNSNQSNSF